MNRPQLNFFTASALMISGAIVHSSFTYVNTLEKRDGRVKEPFLQKLDSHEGSIPSSPTLREMAATAADKCGTPKVIVFQLIQRESSWDPDVVSSSGAVGLMQIKPATAALVSRTLDVFTPWGNLLAGSCHLRDLRDKFGSWRRALHAYRLGPSAKPNAVSEAYVNYIMKGLNGKVE